MKHTQTLLPSVRLAGYTAAALSLLFSVPGSAFEFKQAPLMTDWAPLVDTNNPRSEYPRPQMVRTDWLSLNGIWQFQPGVTNEPAPTNQVLSSEILVPFPMESALSGVMAHHPHSWYRRTFEVPPGWTGQRILLHLDAVDWESEVFINGQSQGIHKGGYDAITLDITSALTGSGPQELIVRVYDPTDNYGQPRGKQTLYPGGIMYTSVSGIWQPVWLEPAPATRIAAHKLIPDIDTEKLKVTVEVAGPTNGIVVHAEALMGTNVVGSIAGAAGAELLLPVPNPTLWSPTNPYLYDLRLTLSNGATQVDSVGSYFGMRKISLGTENGFLKMMLNNSFVFQFGPLDQGFWPDGIYTAPTDDALKSDIEQTKLLGFNMIRKHIKVEPARWYYWADKLGMLVWQDMPSLNSYTGNPKPIDAPQFELELTRMVENHWSHPSIISWVIFNESQGQHDTEALVSLVQGMDPSRLVNQASGGSHYGVGEILDWHSYPNPSCPVSGSQAVVCGEFGGVGLPITNHTWAPGWGYVAATNGDDLAFRFEDFCFQLSDFVANHGLSAAVYTEITDVEIELNGFLTYDRKVRKPDVDRIRTAVASASAPVALTTVLPTSQSAGQSWKYRFTQPGSTWTELGYDDSTSSWTNGTGGFGAGNPPNTTGLTRTTWNTSDIWLRRQFNPGALTSEQISNLFFLVYHDEDVQVYINGVLAASATGYRTSYGLMGINQAGKEAIVPNGNNVIAVHCHQTGGGQYIDVGIVVRESEVTVPPRPAPAPPTGLHGAAGAAGVWLAWTSSTEATGYRIKRATTSGGPYADIGLSVPLNSGMDASVIPNTSYYYVVTATNATGESANSAEVQITTVIPPPPELAAWLKADAITGLANGAAVANWSDSSGNGFNASQGTASRRPTYVTGAINGMPAVHFNAASSNYLAFTRPVQNDFTILCVFRSSQGFGTGVNFWDGAGLVNGEVANTVNDFGLSLNTNGYILGGTGNPDTTIRSANAGFSDGQAHVVSFTRQQATGTIELYVDGAAQGSKVGGKNALTSPSQLVLGAQQTLLHFLNGDIAEVKIYANALSSTDRVAEENALLCKYGLGSGTLPTPPQYLTASANGFEVALDWHPVPGASGYKVAWSTSEGGPFSQLTGDLATNHFTHASATSGQTNFYRVSAYSPCGDGVDYSTAATYLTAPSLIATTDGESLVLSWPDWADGWTLHAATNLNPPVAWSTVTNDVTSSDGSFLVSLPMVGESMFFRLVRL